MFIVSIMQLYGYLNATLTRWHELIGIARNPYRPELHYMRGPGPKWQAKHHRRTDSGAF